MSAAATLVKCSQCYRAAPLEVITREYRPLGLCLECAPDPPPLAVYVSRDELRERGRLSMQRQRAPGKAARAKSRDIQLEGKVRNQSRAKFEVTRWMSMDTRALLFASGLFEAVCLEGIARGHLICKVCGGIFAPGDMTTWQETAPGGTSRTRGRCHFCEKTHTKNRTVLEPILKQRKLEQQGKCYYCGLEGFLLGLEHKIPVSRGGSHDPENIVAACGICNSKKGKRTEAEYRLTLG